MKILLLINRENGVAYHRLYAPFLRLSEKENVHVVSHNEAMSLTDAQLKEFDAVVYNRTISQYVYAEDAIKRLKRLGLKLICDVDDSLKLDPSNATTGIFVRGTKAPLNYGGQRFIESQINSMKLADEIWVSTEYLYDEIKGYNSECHIIKNAIDKNSPHFKANQPEYSTARFGWISFAGNRSKDVEEITTALSIMYNTDEDFVFIWTGFIGREADYKIEKKLTNNYQKGSERYIPAQPYMKMDEYAVTYGNFNVSVAPLADTYWNRCKSDLKILEAEAKGMPIIVSDVEPYKYIRDGVDGFICRKPKDWVRAMKTFINEPSAIKEMGANLSNNPNISSLEEENEKRLNRLSK